MDEKAAVATLSALAQGMRLRVLQALAGAGPQGLTPGALAATLGVSASTLSFHLKALVQAGLASQQRDGRHLVYRPQPARLDELQAYLAAHVAGEPGGAGERPRTPSGAGR
jgi:DNA-binding transcriptional ArsR family regulator